MRRFTLQLGEASEVLERLRPGSIDALITDPPAGISFMGKDWDYDHGGREGWVRAFASIFGLCRKSLKPGSHAFVWALPRTSHWTACALENAGFEIRDIVVHLFGTGFPKSVNLGKGWGTALKPAGEHWILCRVPVEGTVASNVRRHGVGGLNVYGCRIGNSPVSTHCRGSNTAYPKQVSAKTVEETGRTKAQGDIDRSPRQGRWPANVVFSHAVECRNSLGKEKMSRNYAGGLPELGTDRGHTDGGGKEIIESWECEPGCAVAELDRQSGVLKSGAFKGVVQKARPSQRSKGAEYARIRKDTPSSAGAASRFFYCAKPSRSERGEENDHPTVKSLKLMRWLCRLITPPDGIVLDPFMGSGTTGIAAILEGFRFAGIERDRAYFQIAQERIREAK